ncbi:MAG TPA: hypothetical protein VMF61_10000, partial [Candidatus Acidoferrales bacterium]|nr:hypothetical protein [Candidatus Acidoferrales bacterium]
LAFGAYGKYSIALFACAIVAGIAATPQRRVLRSIGFPVAAALAVAALAPNLAWQSVHGWPMLDVLRGDAAHRPAFQSGLALEYGNLARNALAFVLEQIVYTNPFATPVWIAGMAAPFRVASLRDLRFLSVAAALVLITAMLAGAKGYYVVGIYGSLLAVGAVAVERAANGVRIAVLTAVAAAGVAALPLSLPVLGVDTLVGYTKLLGLTGRNGSPAHLVQPVYAEEFGWDRLARDVASVYDGLPAAVRTRTAIYADTYADAGAIDFYGPRYGLPPAISSQNSYYLWGTHGYDGRSLVAIGATRIGLLREFFRSVTLVRTSEEPYKWIVEGPTPIYLCRDPVAPLDVIWPKLRWYGA